VNIHVQDGLEVEYTAYNGEMTKEGALVRVSE